MLDARTLLDDPELVRPHLCRRHADDALLAPVDAVIELAERRVEIIRERDDLRARRNTLSREIGELFKAGRRDEADAAKAEVQAGNERTRVLEEELGQVEATQRDLLLRIPNLLHADVPDGRSDADNVEVRRWGTPREFDFEPHPHVEVGERLGILDFERAAKLTGSRFAVLRGAGARLARALSNFFLDLHTREHGYTEVMVSLLARLHGQFAENREIKRSRWEALAKLHDHKKVVYADMEVDFSRKEISWRATEPTATGLELMTALADPEYKRVDRLCRSYRSQRVAEGVEWLILRCLYAELIDVSCAQEYYFVLEGHLFKRAFSGSVSHLGCMTPTIV